MSNVHEIHSEFDTNGRKVFVVRENTSDQDIDFFLDYDSARSYIRFMKRGGGFIDFTPAFMTRKVGVESEEDDIE